jgi:hypothetical protein
VARWLPPGTGPLKRGTDRIETAARLFLLVAVLAAAPTALLVTTVVRGHLATVATEQAADRGPVRATLLADPPRRTPSASAAAIANAPVARRQWETGWLAVEPGWTAQHL